MGMDAEIEALRLRLQLLKSQQPGGGWTFNMIGNWLIEIGQINLEIAELYLSRKHFEEASWHS